MSKYVTKTKFNLGDWVWLKYKSSGNISKLQISEISLSSRIMHNGNKIERIQYKLSGVFWYDENELFKTKQEAEKWQKK